MHKKNQVTKYYLKNSILSNSVTFDLNPVSQSNYGDSALEIAPIFLIYFIFISFLYEIYLPLI